VPILQATIHYRLLEVETGRLLDSAEVRVQDVAMPDSVIAEPDPDLTLEFVADQMALLVPRAAENIGKALARTYSASHTKP
jgi:hypothetical protein